MLMGLPMNRTWPHDDLRVRKVSILGDTVELLQFLVLKKK